MPAVYLDHNASQPLRPAARAALVAALDLAGNASSLHAPGRGQRRLLRSLPTRRHRLIARVAARAVVGLSPRFERLSPGSSFGFLGGGFKNE